MTFYKKNGATERGRNSSSQSGYSALLPFAIVIGGITAFQLFRSKRKAFPRTAKPIVQASNNADFPPHDGKPVVILPGNGRLIHQVATDLGQALRNRGFFNLNGQAAIIDETTGKLRLISPSEFPDLVEKFLVPATLKDSFTAQPQSLTAALARTILRSEHFVGRIPTVVKTHDLTLPFLSGGKVLLPRPGYDPDTHTFTANTQEYSTTLRAEDAREFFAGLLGSFPFADRETSKSAVLAGLLTLFCPNLYPEGTTTPAFFYSANLPGAGKSLLATLTMIAVLGHVAVSAKPKDQEEMRKMLFAAALENRPVVYLDNIVGAFSSPSLEAFLTSSTISGRILGQSKTSAVKKSTVVLLTGNGCNLGPDMKRRTIPIHLHLPENRGPSVIKDYLDEHRVHELRPQILGALYSLVREWSEGGSQKPSRLNTNFPVWSAVVGGILEANGYPLPY